MRQGKGYVQQPEKMRKYKIFLFSKIKDFNRKNAAHEKKLIHHHGSFQAGDSTKQ